MVGGDGAGFLAYLFGGTDVDLDEDILERSLVKLRNAGIEVATTKDEPDQRNQVFPRERLSVSTKYFAKQTRLEPPQMNPMSPIRETAFFREIEVSAKYFGKKPA